MALRISHLFAHCAVPIFLFISGFLLARDRSPSFGAFVVERLRRIAVPGLLWMTVALGWDAWRGGRLTSDLLHQFLLFNIEGQFYFLVVLAMLMTAGYPLRHASARTVAIVTGVAFVAGLGMVGWYGQQDIAGDFATFAYRNPLVWAYFYAFGLLANRTHGTVSWGPRVETAAVVGMVATFAVYLWQGETYGYPVSYFGVTVYLFSSLGLIVYPFSARLMLRVRVARLLTMPLAWLSPLSFGVFLIHKPYFLGWLSSTVLEGTRFEGSWGQLMLANFVVGGVAAIAFVSVVDRVWPRSALLLGIERHASRPVLGT